MDCSKPFVYVQLPRVRDQQKAWHALSAQLKQVNLLCLSLYTWQCGVGQPSPKKQCSMQKVGYIWKACMNFAKQMGRMLASGGLHQSPVSVDLLGSAVAADLQWHS
jgi:predicted metal-binding transcription factor (methanogenesis marker protein 9)